MEVSDPLFIGGVLGTQQCFNVTILDDSEFELEETFSIILSIEGGRIRSIGSTTTVFIQDDDGDLVIYTW